MGTPSCSSCHTAIPFPLFADLGGAKTVAKDVRLNRKPAFVFKASKTNRTTGDEPALPGRQGVLCAHRHQTRLADDALLFG